MTGDAFELVSYWRRRHDRLVAGVHAVRRQRTGDVADVRAMIDRLLKLDAQPFEDAAQS